LTSSFPCVVAAPLSCCLSYEKAVQAENAPDRVPARLRDTRLLSQRWLQERNTWTLLRLLSQCARCRRRGALAHDRRCPAARAQAPSGG
jgi:hypothetical protein